MSFSVLQLLLAGFALAAAGVAISTPVTKSFRMLDQPNPRSSHSVPTPKGGGVAIVLVVSVGLMLAVALDLIGTDVFLALLGGGLMVAIVGFVDDFRGVSAGVRLAVHFSAALWALAWLDGTPTLQVGAEAVNLTGLWSIFNIVAIIWVLNLFNFMDGIDGIASSEAAFIATAGALLALGMGITSGFPLAAAILGGASVGFLFWNWPPAKIFMGDVGSGYLGYMIAVLVLVGAIDHPAVIWVWLLLGGAFFLDATITLVRRLARGERAYHAHREHAYQWLARRWRSHQHVTKSLGVLNCVWLLPSAIWCALQPDRAIYIVPGAFLPLLVLIILAGAGRSESDAVEIGFSGAGTDRQSLREESSK